MSVVVLGFVILFAVLICAFLTFDRLVRREHDLHRHQWETDGRPIGFFYYPSKPHWLWGSSASRKCFFSWLYRTPTWMQIDKEACGLVRRLRWLVGIWNAGGLVLLVYA